MQVNITACKFEGVLGHIYSCVYNICEDSVWPFISKTNETRMIPFLLKIDLIKG